MQIFQFLAWLCRLWRNRIAIYLNAGKLDGKRAIPHKETDELPEILQQLLRFGNQELTKLAEHFTKQRSAMQSLRKTLFAFYQAARKAHADAVLATGQRYEDLQQARRSFFAFHRRNPIYTGLMTVILTVLLVVLTVAADYPLNMAAFSRLGDNESATQLMGLVFTIILMLDAHTIGALFRSDNPAAKWTARFLGAISLAFVAVLSWMRKDAIIQLTAQNFTTIDPTLVFAFYLFLQTLIFMLAVVIGYWLHEPLQRDFDKKTRAVMVAEKTEKKKLHEEIAAGRAAQTAWDTESHADDVYVHRDQQLRENIEERRSVYLRANRAVRDDLEDGKLPKAYTKPLPLVRPRALEDALARINSRAIDRGQELEVVKS